ncbi:homocysteine S-methyltransferase family protein [Candidatus Peregrinibacteria bacterium]|nr:homocysteine S-methyltransferase family protein [Candidatus Peregrinibacteria bacterium]
MNRIEFLKNRLKNKEKILLAGACGTEIQRRGIKTELPLWSASALITNPEIVSRVHEDYIKAGSDIITTNTFRTNRRTLQKINKGDESEKLTKLAVKLALKARIESGRKEVLIGGSIAPLEDCYEPKLVPSDKELWQEHSEQAENLAKNGVDFLFIETINTIREAKIAFKACKKTGLEVAISFVCNKNGNLLSGESIEAAYRAISPLAPLAILTNCAPPQIAEISLYKLLKISKIPIVFYANGDGMPHDELGWKFLKEKKPEDYLKFAQKWLKDGASIIGGCCGTNPEYIKLIRKYMNRNQCNNHPQHHYALSCI